MFIVMLQLLCLLCYSCYVYCYVTVAYVCIPRSFLVTNVCNQGKTLCSPCRSVYFNFRIFGKKTCKQKILNRLIAVLPRVLSALVSS